MGDCVQFDQLKCFVEVAETKSFSKAAERLFMSQQAISKNVKNLEEDLGCELFFRTKNGVVLTLSGESVLEFAQKFFETEKDLTEKLGSIQRAFVAEVTDAELIVGSISPIINSTLPAVLGRIETKGNVNTFMKLYDSNDLDDLLENVHKKKIQFGLVTSREDILQEKLQSYYSELDMFIIAQDKLVAVVHRNHYDAEMEHIDFEHYVAKHPLTAYNFFPELDFMQYWTERLYPIPTISYSNDETFHCNMMKELGAITIMPEIVYQKKFSSKKYVSMQLTQQLPIPLVHAVIYYKDPEYSVDSFLSMFRRELYAK